MTPQDKHMPFIDAMHMYFRGEKIEAIYFIAVTGLLLVIYRSRGPEGRARRVCMERRHTLDPVWNRAGRRRRRRWPAHRQTGRRD
ncbi:hypothetical protein XACLG98_330015 [Xanthomonas citri pv. citri]|nr:hypothetical protein XACLG98_330015 [Xanthomonas citri pv. citri]